jgi:hypothetical protein
VDAKLHLCYFGAMTKRSRVILSTVAVLAVLGLTVWLVLPSGPPDPVYGGHRLSFYLSVIAPSQDWLNTRLLDSNAVPYLIHTLKQHDSSVRRAYIRAYPRLPAWLSSPLGYPVSATRRKFIACDLLGSMGATARPAIQELIHLAGSKPQQGTETLPSAPQPSSPSNSSIPESAPTTQPCLDPRPIPHNPCHPCNLWLRIFPS